MVVKLPKCAIEFYSEAGKLLFRPSVLEGEAVKLLTLLVFAGLAYAGARLLLNVLKELAEIAAEAWHSGETER